MGHDCSGRSSITPTHEQRVFLIRPHGLVLGTPVAISVGFE